MPQEAQIFKPLSQVSTQVGVQYLQPSGLGLVASHRSQSPQIALQSMFGYLDKCWLQAEILGAVHPGPPDKLLRCWKGANSWGEAVAMATTQERRAMTNFMMADLFKLARQFSNS